MRTLLCVLAVYHLLSTCFSFTMDTPSPIITIKNIEQPTSVAFCKNKIFIAGKNGLGVYNPCTQLFTFLSGDLTYHLALDSGRHNLAASSKTQLAVYDTKTETKKYFCMLLPNKDHPIIFSSDNKLFSYNNAGSFTAYDSQLKMLHQNAIPCDHKNTAPVTYPSFHPSHNTILYPSGKQTLTLISSDDFWNNHSITSQQNSYINTGVYSPDGTMLAINDDYHHCCIMDLTDNSEHLIRSQSDNQYISMAFHPHYNILALLTTISSIEYWNYKTKQLIGITHEFCTIPYIKNPEKYLDFNEKGTQLIAALDEKCILLNCPQKYLLTIYSALENNGLPKELRFIIFNYLPACLGLKELNFLPLLDI